MPDTDPLATELAAIRDRIRSSTIGIPAARTQLALDDAPRLVAAVAGVLSAHKIRPLYAHADNGECGCPVPGEAASIADDIVYDSSHPEGQGPEGTGLVCTRKIAGYWCPGCADVAVEHGCFEVPKAYPAEKCTARALISAALLGEAATNASH